MPEICHCEYHYGENHPYGTLADALTSPIHRLYPGLLARSYSGIVDNTRDIIYLRSYEAVSEALTSNCLSQQPYAVSRLLGLSTMDNKTAHTRLKQCLTTAYTDRTNLRKHIRSAWNDSHSKIPIAPMYFMDLPEIVKKDTPIDSPGDHSKPTNRGSGKNRNTPNGYLKKKKKDNLKNESNYTSQDHCSDGHEDSPRNAGSTNENKGFIKEESKCNIGHPEFCVKQFGYPINSKSNDFHHLLDLANDFQRASLTKNQGISEKDKTSNQDDSNEKLNFVQDDTSVKSKDGPWEYLTVLKRFHGILAFSIAGVPKKYYSEVDEFVELNNSLIKLSAPLGGVGTMTIPLYKLLINPIAIYKRVANFMSLIYYSILALPSVYKVTKEIGIISSLRLFRPDLLFFYYGSVPTSPVIAMNSCHLPNTALFFLKLYKYIIEAEINTPLHELHQAVLSKEISWADALSTTAQLFVNITSVNGSQALLLRLAEYGTKKLQKHIQKGRFTKEHFRNEFLRLDTPLHRTLRRVKNEWKPNFKPPKNIIQIPDLENLSNNSKEIYEKYSKYLEDKSTDLPFGSSPFVYGKKNQLVILSLMSSNLDPDVWENPLEFDPSRWKNSKNQLLGFGRGGWSCLGKILVETTIDFIIDIALDSPGLHYQVKQPTVDYDVGNFGFKELITTTPFWRYGSYSILENTQ